jgi:hypothetical protein
LGHTINETVLLIINLFFVERLWQIVAILVKRIR